MFGNILSFSLTHLFSHSQIKSLEEELESVKNAAESYEEEIDSQGASFQLLDTQVHTALIIGVT